MTYPAWPVNGIMVSGFPTPGDTPDSFYPEDMREKVGTAGQQDEEDFRLLTVEQQVATLETQMDRMSDLIRSLMDHEYDLFFVVHRIPDPVHHFFIKFVDQRTPAYDPDEAQRWGDLVNRFYRKMDVALGEALDRISPEDTVIVISDHGGAITPPRQLNLNVWLAEQGLLTPKAEARGLKETVYALNQRILPAKIRSMLRRHAPKTVQGELRSMWKGLQQIDLGQTQAYQFPMKCPPLTGVVINVRGRQDQGVVAPEEYEGLRDRLIDAIRMLRDPKTGEKVVRDVFKREDLYEGEFVERAPDIVIWCHDMYKEGMLAQGPLVGEVPYDELVQVPGSHDETGIFLARGPGIVGGKEVREARLIDVPPTVLHSMELPVPSDMDGRVLVDIFDEEGREVQSVDMEMPRQSQDSFLSQDEEQQIKEKLKGWGYL